jgi:Domain of unknown function (DUF4112)
MSNVDQVEILMGPDAAEAIKTGKESPITREAARGVVTEESTKQREKMRQEVETKLSPEQQEILEKLRKATGSQERVKLFATFADDFGLDALVGLVPELGDAGSSIISGVYLLMEAKRAGLGATSYLKIIGLQAADMAVGAVPILGDAADYFFKANKWSGSSFEKNTQDLVEKARAAGVPEKDIQILTHSASKWPQLLLKGVGMAGKLKK